MSELRICKNPMCLGASGLKPNERPIVYLADTCWNCHKSDFLEIKK